MSFSKMASMSLYRHHNYAAVETEHEIKEQFLQSNQVRRTPLEYINEMIVSKKNYRLFVLNNAGIMHHFSNVRIEMTATKSLL